MHFWKSLAGEYIVLLQENLRVAEWYNYFRIVRERVFGKS